MKDTVIFDLDGTLLYTLEDLTDSVNFSLLHFRQPKRTIEQIKSFVGNGVERLIELALEGGRENPCFYEALELFKGHYKKNMYNKTKPYDGICEMLEKLESSGVFTVVLFGLRLHNL